MPIYVYRCQSCQEYTEALQKVSDPLLTTCPNCGAEALTKVIAPVGVIFKGSGFHKNDYTAQSAKSTTSKPGSDGDKSTTAETSTPTTSESTTTTPATPPPASGGDSSGKVA